MSLNWKEYEADGLFDEMIDASGRPRAAAEGLANHLAGFSPEELAAVQAASEVSVRNMGVSFTV